MVENTKTYENTTNYEIHMHMLKFMNYEQGKFIINFALWFNLCLSVCLRNCREGRNVWIKLRGFLYRYY